LDKLVSLFDILAKQYYLGLFSKSDLDLISYEYLVVFQNLEVKKYFSFLEGWFKKRGIRNPPFAKFMQLGEVVKKTHYNNI
jgi:hypothetical protein